MRILVTAFEPFLGQAVNPSQMAMRLLPDAICGAHIQKLALPTRYHDALSRTLSEIKDACPDAVVSLGQAGGRIGITPERIAVNLADSEAADNSGLIMTDAPVCPGGPAAYFTTLPVKAMCRRISAEGLPASLSLSAGAYVCNYLMYGVLHALFQTSSRVRAGFVHVPYIPEQVLGKIPTPPSMPLSDIVRGVHAALRAVAEDLKG